MKNNIYQQVIKCEYEFTTLLSRPLFRGNYIRYCDDNLRDKYDHNYSELLGEINDDIYQEILMIKKERNEPHIKIITHDESDYLLKRGLEETCTLTMVGEKLNVKPSKLPNLTFKNTKTNREIINDILDLECRFYGPLFGYDFVARNIMRYYAVSLRNKKLNLFGCYYNNKIIGYCYAYHSFGVVGIDNLLVDDSFRNNGVASNLISYIKNYYNCPIYLHADSEDTPKDLYLKIGFKTVHQFYEYFSLDEGVKIE